MPFLSRISFPTFSLLLKHNVSYYFIENHFQLFDKYVLNVNHVPGSVLAMSMENLTRKSL